MPLLSFSIRHFLSHGFYHGTESLPRIASWFGWNCPEDSHLVHLTYITYTPKHGRVILQRPRKFVRAGSPIIFYLCIEYCRPQTVTTMAERKSKLTPEQKAALAEMQEKVKGKPLQIVGSRAWNFKFPEVQSVADLPAPDENGHRTFLFDLKQPDTFIVYPTVNPELLPHSGMTAEEMRFRYAHVGKLYQQEARYGLPAPEKAPGPPTDPKVDKAYAIHVEAIENGQTPAPLIVEFLTEWRAERAKANRRNRKKGIQTKWIPFKTELRRLRDAVRRRLKAAQKRKTDSTSSEPL
jgi:hypothetical protein